MTQAGISEAFLEAALAPAARAPDSAFAARVRLAVAEEQRFRAWRKAALRRIGSDALIILGLIGPALGAARVLSASGPLTAPTAALMICTLVVGGWIMMSGELRRFEAC